MLQIETETRQVLIVPIAPIPSEFQIRWCRFSLVLWGSFPATGQY